MMRISILLLAIASATLVAQAAPPQPTAKEHPIVGRWVITLPDGSCTETYTFRPDGTTLVMSGEEIAETVFEISPKPAASGFYKLTDKLVKDNGKKDCSGVVTETGQTLTNYVQFNATGSAFIMCADESLDKCIGPFRRVQGTSI